jgi:hypothetical protein
VPLPLIATGAAHPPACCACTHAWSGQHSSPCASSCCCQNCWEAGGHLPPPQHSTGYQEAAVAAGTTRAPASVASSALLLDNGQWSHAPLDAPHPGQVVSPPQGVVCHLPHTCCCCRAYNKHTRQLVWLLRAARPMLKGLRHALAGHARYMCEGRTVQHKGLATAANKAANTGISQHTGWCAQCCSAALPAAQLAPQAWADTGCATAQACRAGLTSKGCCCCGMSQQRQAYLPLLYFSISFW